ncbi:MAG TPA: hypothetical protein VE870_13390 [Bacteroidales bacterium]|nr:hypothetical protein [Bacteroidales bacterium]
MTAFRWLLYRVFIPAISILVLDPYGLGYEAGTAGVSLIEGRDIAFNGKKEPSDGNFVFDLTDILDEDYERPWNLRIINKGPDPLIIKKIEI